MAHKFNFQLFIFIRVTVYKITTLFLKHMSVSVLPYNSHIFMNCYANFMHKHQLLIFIEMVIYVCSHLQYIYYDGYIKFFMMNVYTIYILICYQGMRYGL